MAGDADHRDLSSLDRALAYSIQRLARLLRYNLLHFFERAGADVTPEQWIILFRLHERDGQSPRDLADATLEDRPNITRLVDALEGKKLVRRLPDAEDGRRTLVCLTPDGRRLLDRMFPLVVRERERLFGDLTDQEVQALRSAFRKIEARLLTED